MNRVYFVAMFRLTREVRFSLNDNPDDQLAGAVTNGYGGFPTHSGFGMFLRLQVTLRGDLDARSSYLRNIKEVDSAVRDEVIGVIAGARSVAARHPEAPVGDLATTIFAALKQRWPGQPADAVGLDAVALWLTPYLCLSAHQGEFPMSSRLSQKFEFSASHRLFHPDWSDEQNRQTYGKCANPHGHGHNYELQVTLRGNPKTNGLLVDVAALEKIVGEFVISRLDHKNLNVEVPEFKDVVPSVENISRVIYRMLKNRITGIGAELASVIVWETPKTWCEYSE